MSDSYFKKNPNSKKAFVLSGGGARGSFEIGVWEGLKDIGFLPDIITGISVGALNGALVAQGDFEKAKNMWKEIQTHNILDYDFPLEIDSFKDYRRTLGGFIIKAIFKNGMSTQPLESLINEYLASEKELRNKNIEFGIVVTNYRTKEEKSFYLDELEEGQLKQTLLASASLYPVMEKVYIDDVPYVDGGYENHIPFDLAMEKNPDEIVIVDLQPERKIVINDEYKDKNIIVIKSEWYLGDLLIFDQSRNDLNIALGYNEVMKATGDYTGHMYTFNSKDTLEESEKFYVSLNKLLSGESLETLNQFINDENNQIDLVNSISDKWGKSFDDKTFPFSMIEVTAKLFHISPGEIYSISELQEKIIDTFFKFSENDDEEVVRELIPEYTFGIEEWKEYLENKFSLLPNRKTAFYFYTLFNDKTVDLSKLKYQILFKLKPFSLAVSLYLYYLIDKTRK